MKNRNSGTSLLAKVTNMFNRQKKSYYPGIFPESCYQTFFWNTPGKPVFMQRDYKKFSEEAYIKNVIAHRSISLIAQGAASVPWRLFHISQDTKRELREHPLLRLLSNPNPCENGKEFMTALYSYRMISGNSFVQAVTPTDSNPTELHTLRPDRVSVVPGKDGMPAAYHYQVGDMVQKFPVDGLTCRSAILHLKNFHPLNDYYGLSNIEAAAYSIDQHNHSSLWNQAMLQNGARPSGALVVKSGNDNMPGVLDDEQYLRIKNQMDEQFSGAANAGRPLLLEGGLDWREMSLSPKDMDFIESKHSSARDIALAFGVPPQLLGIPGDNTYSNLVEARMAMWEQTILPMVDNITTALNNWLLPQFGTENLRLYYNTDEVPALAPKREKHWNRIEKSSFMTINEKRQAMGMEPIAGGDTIQRI